MLKPDILYLSGWAQNPESLSNSLSYLSSSYKIINFDYTRFSVENCFLELKKLEINPKIIIGWSLGGQIAARLISEKIVSSQLLVLISAPFQFVKSEQDKDITNLGIAKFGIDKFIAMPKAGFESFRNNFINNSAQTLEKFSLLMMLVKNNLAKDLARNLYIDEKNYLNLILWLEELGKFSCLDLDYSNFPRTLIIHGENDLVVNYSQAKVFASKITNSKLEILKNCSHCPHISNLPEMQKVIDQEIVQQYYK